MRIDREVRSRLVADALNVLFMALVVVAANGFHIGYILFPELGAVTSDVLLRPEGKWARVPWKLVATPTMSAAIGIGISSQLPYGVPAILLATCSGIGLLFLLKSAVAPAISAGVLPVALAITSWLYPVCIFGTLTILAGTLLIWRKTQLGITLCPNRQLNLNPDQRAVEILESRPKGKWWLPSLLVFVTLIGLLALLTTWRFILFPPLIVMAYEMLGHPETCPWAKQPYSFPLICFAAAFVGVEAVTYLGPTPIAAGIVLMSTIALLRGFRLRMPPALAIGLIPFILPTPTILYAFSVGIGTTCLTLWFKAFSRFARSVP